MLILLIKLCLTPILMAAATLAGRRWGAGVSGWLIGFPLTSGPISLALTLQNGVDFAARAAIGALGGQISVCVFCLAYSLAARRNGWPVSAALSALAFLLSTIICNSLTLFLLPTFICLLIVVVIFARIIPQPAVTPLSRSVPAWDLPARMGTAVAFVFLLTTFSSRLGAQLSGLLSPFPVFGLVLAIFAQYNQGANAAIRLLRGNIIGSVAFAAFFLVVGLGLPHFAVGWVYGMAVLAAIIMNGFLLRLVYISKTKPA